MKKVLLMLLLACHPAFAGLTLTLNPSAQPVSAGSEALFSGILTNTSSTERLFLNDIAASFTANPQGDTALASNAFFASVPGILQPGESYEGPLFQLTLTDSSPAANYTGSITVRGGVTITANADLASASVTLLATPVEQWRHRTFGDDAAAPLAADDGDADHDGVENLLEYALSMDALTPDVSLLPAALVAERSSRLQLHPFCPRCDLPRGILDRSDPLEHDRCRTGDRAQSTAAEPHHHALQECHKHRREGFHAAEGDTLRPRR